MKRESAIFCFFVGILVALRAEPLHAGADFSAIIRALFERSTSVGRPLAPSLRGSARNQLPKAHLASEFRDIFDNSIFVGEDARGLALFVHADELSHFATEVTSSGGIILRALSEAPGKIYFTIGRGYSRAQLRGVQQVAELMRDEIQYFSQLVAREFAEAGYPQIPEMLWVESALARTVAGEPYALTRLSLNGLEADPAVLERVLQQFAREFSGAPLIP